MNGLRRGGIQRRVDTRRFISLNQASDLLDKILRSRTPSSSEEGALEGILHVDLERE